jgi:phosphoribosylformimino-5-aminoimidazole carboxamide ribonucleotide (ProFAR) isomerase
MPGLYGCIIGKALYDHKLTLAELSDIRDAVA